MSWCPSSQITSLFTGSLRFSHARVSISIARHLPAGSAQRVNWSRRWSMRSGSMSWLDRRSMATTRQFLYLHPATAGPRPRRLWTYVRDDRPAAQTTAPAVWFAYSEDRKGEHPRRHLKDFSGALQADAYSGLHHLYGDGRIYEVACWAHARRKFHDIHVTHRSPITTEALNRIGALYGIEEQVRGKPPDVRCSVRQAQSKPILDDSVSGWRRCCGLSLAKSETAGAIRYALSHWRALTRYVDDGLLEIDNSAAERALRAVSIGRKNYLFFGADSGGERAADNVGFLSHIRFELWAGRLVQA